MDGCSGREFLCVLDKMARMSEYGIAERREKFLGSEKKREIMDKTSFELNFRNEPNFNARHKVSEHLKFASVRWNQIEVNVIWFFFGNCTCHLHCTGVRSRLIPLLFPCSKPIIQMSHPQHYWDWTVWWFTFSKLKMMKIDAIRQCSKFNWWSLVVWCVPPSKLASILHSEIFDDVFSFEAI